MIAWYGEQKLKDAAMEQLREHRRLDQLVQKIYFDNGKGCHLGCLTHRNTNSQAATERMFGIEERVAYWLEVVFENLPKEGAAAWVIESTESIPVGADLSMCHHELAYWLLDPVSPIGADNSHELVRDEIAQVRECHRLALLGEEADWAAAYSSAYSAAGSATYSSASSSAYSAASSARSATESAAESAAESARSAAESSYSATYSAYSAAYSSAYSAAWRIIAAKSIEIFLAAPVRVANESERCDQCVAESMIALGADAMVGKKERVK